MGQGILEVQGVSKAFGPLKALVDVSAKFVPGEVHAVLGENGAGKSTLMNLIAGFLAPDSGSITLDGRSIPSLRPFDVQRMGIGFVHQHFTLVPEFTVEENLALARLDSLTKILHREALATPAMAVAKRLGWDIPLKTRVRDLSVGTQQRVEILKALSGDPQVLLFDEPTAPLTPAEAEELLKDLRGLAASGKTILLIAHKLAEVFRAADQITVLRRGHLVGGGATGGFNPSSLATLMVGEAMVAPQRTEGHSAPEVILHATDLTVRADRGEDAVRGVSLDLRGNEILGIGGVDGNGQIELAEALARVRPLTAGTIDSPSDAEFEIGYIPGDRKREGLAPGLSVAENLLIGGLKTPGLSGRFALKPRRILEWAKGLIKRYEIKVESPFDEAGSLSGGNQQKIIVSRTLDKKPRVVVAVNPTRGLDVKAAQYVREQLRVAADGGAAVALFSADLDELKEVADHIVFMSAGVIHDDASAEALFGGVG